MREYERRQNKNVMNSLTREAPSLGSVSAFRDQYDPVLRESSSGSRVALVGTENVPVKTFDIRWDIDILFSASLSLQYSKLIKLPT